MTIKVVDDILQLSIDFRVILRPRTNLGERFSGVGDAVLLHQPARGFGLEEDACEQKGAGEHLKGEGDSPLFGCCGGDGLVDAVVDEVGEHYSRDAVITTIVSIQSPKLSSFSRVGLGRGEELT